MTPRCACSKVLAYADLLARDPGRVPSADVAWKLRSIVNGPDAAVPDAPVIASAEVKIRRHVCTPACGQGPPPAHTCECQ